ncbi:DNA alkylation repair protein [Flavihumibacter fluvii]|uniref:DNA alkylation repair protein n=1 Tax=Flavihumibacter fluvii TaxID=2838157 RepID=UPI001BDEF9EB|nr:DNA alkylation repair protein [Flavihumibacter fluvii]ULQ54350.1 DNA alkylation repair protein [Flavihumibacter fluvii]
MKNILINPGGTQCINPAMQKKPKQLFDELTAAMQFHRDAANAAPMARYMKNQFDFLGIKQPVRKALSADFLKAARLLDGKEIIAICDALWKLPEREYQLVALELLYASRKKFDAQFLDFFGTIVVRKAWWDTVDFIATKLFGTYYANTKRPAQMIAWSMSDELWKNRTAILFQLNYKKETDVELLFEIIRRLKGKKEFFIQKAIGWSLRQYYRTDPEAVKNFVVAEGITGLAKREALKHSL